MQHGAVVLLALTSCTADTFVGVGDAMADAFDAANLGDAGQDAAEADAAVFAVTCGNASCQQGEVCCSGAAWTSPSCEPASSAGAGACSSFLACDRKSDCPDNTICCAATTSAAGSTLILSATCRSTCNGGSEVLCSSSADCASGSCGAVNGAPSWITSCQ